MQRWDYLVAEHTVMSVVVGSHAFGLATGASDVDRRGVYVVPADLLWRLEKPPTHLQGPREEQFSWEVERFCELALVGNPNILEVLHSPLVEHRTPVGEELRALAPAFLSRRVHRTFCRYAEGQFARAESIRARGGRPKGKHLLHLLRLLASCVELLETGMLRLHIGGYGSLLPEDGGGRTGRDWLLAVGAGEVGWEEVGAARDRLRQRADAALATSPLPEEPDTARVDEWLVSVRRRTLDLERVSV